MPDRPTTDQARRAVSTLLEAFRALAAGSGLDDHALMTAAAVALRTGREHGALDVGAAAPPDDAVVDRAAALLREQLTGGEADADADAWLNAELFHPCIHVSPGFSYYSFPRRHGGARYANRLYTLDSDGRSYPTSHLDGRLSYGVALAERHLAGRAGGVPGVLASAAALAEAIKRLRTDFPHGLPFAAPVHERRLRVWCLLSYLHPLVERTPILQVRVPDVRSARNVMDLLERCTFNALTVARGDMASAVRRHREARAGATIFGPEIKSARLPRCALDYLEQPPRRWHHEPPVAYVELQGRFTPPRVPEDWLVQVELPEAVPEVTLPADFAHLGCAVALSEGGRRVAALAANEAGVAAGLHELLFGEPPAVPGAEERGAPPPDDPLASQVEAVWARCLEEGEGGAEDERGRACNMACLHERLMERFPDMREQLEQAGWSARGLRRRLVERGIVVYGVRNISACLSPEKSCEWRNRGLSGVEVPEYRLPVEHRTRP
jgi:hypothetical protein